MNVYDFDGTIYEGDSTADFWKFSMKKHPKCLRTLPGVIVFGIAYGLHLADRDRLKTHIYKFLQYIPDVDADLEEFWNRQEKNIMPWYYQAQKPDDLIISASPQFLLEPICARLGKKLIASPVDKKTGALTGLNNHGTRKVERFYAAFPGERIENFYSDKHTDDPLAAEAEHAYLAIHGKISDWK